MEVKIDFDKSTSISQKKPTGVAPATLGGALFEEADPERNLPDRYRLVTADNMDILVNSSSSVFGSSREVILSQLDQRHPTGIDETSYLYPYQGEVKAPLDKKEELQYHRRRRRHSWENGCEKFDGWFVADRPYYNSLNLDVAVKLIQDHGVIYVPSDFASLHDAATLRDAGFVLVARRYDIYQLNFNPQRTRLDEYHKKSMTFTKRSTGHFPEGAVLALANLLRPQYFNRKPWNVQVPEFYAGTGVGRVIDMLELSRRLYGRELWWREHSRYSRHYLNGRRTRRVSSGGVESYTMKEAIEACVPFAYTELQRHKDPEGPGYNKNYVLFDRWLRQEARYLEIPIPLPPKKPKKPKPLRKRKRRKRKSRGLKKQRPSGTAS